MIRFGENCWFMVGLRVFWCGFGVGEGYFMVMEYGFLLKNGEITEKFTERFLVILVWFGVFYFGNGEVK